MWVCVGGFVCVVRQSQQYEQSLLFACLHVTLFGMTYSVLLFYLYGYLDSCLRKFFDYSAATSGNLPMAWLAAAIAIWHSGNTSPILRMR